MKHNTSTSIIHTSPKKFDSLLNSGNSIEPNVDIAAHTGHGYIRQKELMKILPFSPATLWRMVKAGTFVKPIKLSDRITAWNRADVHQWLRNKQGGRA
jgi:predicted DNA-binding transcriptional regulator AlpA